MSKPLPLVRHFRKLKDPRLDRRKLHSLEAILVIAICAVIAGANDFQQVALFGQKRKDWLQRFLELPNGIPSHDTFERVFARLDPLTFQECFAGWMNAWYARLTGKHLAIDGKAVRGSASPRKGFRCLHLVNVWATQANLCLGLAACDADSNEITAIPRLLALLDLEGALVTIDAVGCQKKIAQQVLEYMHVPHDMTLPPNRQVWLAQNKVKDSDLDESSPDHFGSTLDVADASAPESAQAPTPMPSNAKPSAAQGAVVPAALKQKEPVLAPQAATEGPTQDAAAGATKSPTNGTVVLDVEPGGIEVPSFIGKSVRSAIETAQESGLEMNPVGSGIAREQSPAAGSHVTAGSRVLVKFGR